MEWLAQFSTYIENNESAVLVSVSAAALVLALICLYLLGSVVMLKRRYSFLLRHEQTQDLGEVFSVVKRDLEELQTEHQETVKRLRAACKQLETCVQNVGLVRFDAFDDVGGEQSYAVAFLDAKDNGVVLSSLYSRNDSRTYAKMLKAGQPGHNLTTEEQQAINLAHKSEGADKGRSS